MSERGSAAEKLTGDEAVVSSPGRFLLLALQLGLIAGIVYLFEIERGRHFFPVLCLAVAGFAIHTWLPHRYRAAFFALLSAASVPFVIGWTWGLLVLGIGGALVGICYLPVGLVARVILLAATGVALVLMRVSWPLPIWPVLGSMFMFRLIVYVFSTRRAAQKPPWSTTTAYFFMLPNVCFPLFPVVDYSRFRDSWYETDEWKTYQRGVTWIVRGIAHLLLYRYIQTNWMPAPYELYDLPHLAWFAVANYALYLRVSGQFHLITGLLHLFGFNLPRTHFNYFLASSFTDIWRRINVYWKDFLAKVFFFPTYYALHGRGYSLAVSTVTGVMCVFICTWLLHSWQTFWLLGAFPLEPNDAALWLVAGACVAVNALLDARRSQRTTRMWWGSDVRRAAQTVGMFVLVSLFWACWTSPEFPSLVVGAWNRPGSGTGLLVVLSWLAAAILAGVILLIARRWIASTRWQWPAMSFKDAALLRAVMLGAVVVVSSPWFGWMLSETTAARIAEFRKDPASADAALAEIRGYYEDLNRAAIQPGPLITALSPFDESRRSQAAGFDRVTRRADPYQAVELIPGVYEELGGSSLSVNRFGMRDRDDLSLNKPRGTVRIAIVGSSVVMGYGVADDEVFTRVFEQQLNAAHPSGPRYEVLNFGVGKQWSSHRLVRIQRQVLGFDPDAVYYVAHQDEFAVVAEHIAGLVSLGLKLPSGELEAVAVRAGVTPDMPPGQIRTHLEGHLDELLLAVYQTIVRECRSRDIVPVWIYLPIPTDEATDIAERVIPLARQAGFVVCDLSDWMNGRPVEDVLPAPDNPHVHAAGHRLIAEALMRMVQSQPEALPRGPVGRD